MKQTFFHTYVFLSPPLSLIAHFLFDRNLFRWNYNRTTKQSKSQQKQNVEEIKIDNAIHIRIRFALLIVIFLMKLSLTFDRLQRIMPSQQKQTTNNVIKSDYYKQYALFSCLILTWLYQKTLMDFFLLKAFVCAHALDLDFHRSHLIHSEIRHCR